MFVVPLIGLQCGVAGLSEVFLIKMRVGIDNVKKWSFSIAFFIFMMVVIVTESRAVEYELPDTNGKVQSLEQYKGQWLIVNYWATWCALCMEEMPELIDFHKNNAVDAAVVGINFEEIDATKLKAFVREKTIPYMVLSTLPIKKTPIG
ncbi:MAG: redoxin domain-containing protein, partial [Gammaproteobacteria bacterium]|nr:redoxin domain-containing protein [Gammaproteobacteria bacterium]